MLLRLVCVAVGLVLSHAAFAQSFMPDLAGGPQKVRRVKELPVGTLQMVELADGRVYLQSSDGRLVVMGGRWMDLFEGKVVTSIDDASTFDRVHLDKMGFRVDQSYHFDVGTGPETVVALIDPIGAESRSMLAQAVKLADRYTFRFVLTPFNGAASADASKRLACAKDQRRAFDALLAGESALQALPKAPDNCDVEPLKRAMILAKLVHATALPVAIRSDGQVQRGAVRDLAKTLSAQKERN